MWIARDQNGVICLYENRPTKRNNYFVGIDNLGYIYLPKEWFPEVTWENSPKEVEFNIKN